MRIIENAIKANFMPGQYNDWKQIITTVLMHVNGMRSEDFPSHYGKHLELMKKNSYYRIKFGLVQNYVRLMK